MSKIEDNLINKEKSKDVIQNSSREVIILVDLVKEDTKKLKGAINQSVVLEKTLDNYDLSSPEFTEDKQELNQINLTKEETLNDWEETSEAIIESSDFEIAKEDWRKAAEEQFGIKDFNLELFERTHLKQEAVSVAFASGKNWDFIYDNIDEFIEDISYDEAVRAFESMRELDTEIPGSAKDLHEKLGINNFQRYPKEILLNQLNNIDQEKEIGLLIFATADHNGAFDNQTEIWNKIYNERKDDLNFRIVECDSSTSLDDQLLKVKQDFSKKISFASFSAHSYPEGFSLNGEVTGDGFVGPENIKKLSSNMKDMFADNAQVLANACSSGAINGWVKDLSKETKIKAVGPDRPAAIKNIDFLGKEIIPSYYDGSLDSQNNIDSRYYKGFLLSKKGKKN